MVDVWNPYSLMFSWADPNLLDQGIDGADVSGVLFILKAAFNRNKILRF